jgi:L-fuculose-phosphate aldolase
VVDRHGSEELTLRQQMVDVVARACDRQLMISTEGVVSARVDDRSFLITPTGQDRRDFEIEDMVLIRDGQREAGKFPSRSVRLHRAIYQQHPGIHCVLMAQSPNATAYAITDTPLDTKTIPESYIMLRDIPVIPYGSQFSEPDRIACVISERTPVVLVQNDCVITVGRSVLEAFDRLEVAEYTARSLIETATIGTLIPMGEQEIKDLHALIV